MGVVCQCCCCIKWRDRIWRQWWQRMESKDNNSTVYFYGKNRNVDLRQFFKNKYIQLVKNCIFSQTSPVLARGVPQSWPEGYLRPGRRGGGDCPHPSPSQILIVGVPQSWPGGTLVLAGGYPSPGLRGTLGEGYPIWDWGILGKDLAPETWNRTRDWGTPTKGPGRSWDWGTLKMYYQFWHEQIDNLNNLLLC